MKILKNIWSYLKAPRISQRVVALFFLTCLAAAVIPLLVLSFYNRPFGDDFTFGIQTAITWRHTHDLWQVFLSTFETIDIFYKWWQGTFTAIFLFTLQPGIFGEQWYFLTTFILMGTLFFGVAYLLYAVIVKLLKGNVWSFLSISSVILLLAVLFVPDANSAFFFYNGGIYYTYFFSLMLILFGLLIRFDLKTKKVGKVLRAIGVIFLSLFIAGGNYATALVTVLLLAAYALLVSIKTKKFHWLATVSFVGCLVVLILSMAAPGNAYRAATVTTNKTAFMAIISSLLGGLSYFEQWTSLVVIGCLVLLTPLMKPILLQSPLRFRSPGWVCLGTFLAFSSQLTPTQYALGENGPSRLVDMYYFSYLLVIFFMYFYVLGYFYRTNPKKENAMLQQPIGISPIFFVLVFGFIAFSLFVRPMTEINQLPTFSAIRSLVSGEAKTYVAEMDARFAMLNDPNVDNVTLSLLTVHPALFPYELAGSNPAAYPNHDMALYYEKASIIIA